MKTCSKCREVKPPEEFYRASKEKDGRQSSCKECTKQYYRDNRAAFIAKARTWEQANPEKVREKQKRWAASERGKEKSREKSRRYYARHREERREEWKAQKRAYRERARHIFNQHQARRRALTRGATVDRVDYAAILERDDWHCYLCSMPIEPGNVHFDHVIPLSKGGAHSNENIRATHAHCNLRKNNRLISSLTASTEAVICHPASPQ